MKISVHYLLPMFALMLTLFGQIGTALQYDDQTLADEISYVSVLTLDLGDDPDSLSPLVRAQPDCYASSHSFSAAQHESIILLVTCADARAPPLV